MDTATGIIAMVPAFGSKKDLLLSPFLGRPLLAQSVHYGKACAEVMRVFVATTDPGLEAAARAAGAEIFPFDLSESDPEASLRQHLHQIETHGEFYRWVLWLDPMRPLQDRYSVLECFQRCIINGEADGIVSVSPAKEGEPAWILDDENWLRRAPDGATAKRWVFNGCLKLLRADAYRGDPLPLEKMNCMAYFSTPASTMLVSSSAAVPAAEATARAHKMDFEWLLV